MCCESQTYIQFMLSIPLELAATSLYLKARAHWHKPSTASEQERLQEQQGDIRRVSGTKMLNINCRLKDSQSQREEKG